jgi:hypothetical protein
VYRLKYNELWLSTGEKDNHPVDAILRPSGPGAAPPHGNAKYWNYTSQWNLLEYPGVVFPVPFADQELDLKGESYVPRNKQDDLIGNFMRRRDMWKRQLDCRSLQGGLRTRSVWLFWGLWRGLWDVSDGGGGRKGAGWWRER